MTPGQQLKAIRTYLSHDRKITQEEFAAWLGISRSVYSRMERDQYKLSDKDRLFIRLLFFLMQLGKLKGFYWGG